MIATLDIDRDGDYRIEISLKEMEELQAGDRLYCPLAYHKDGKSETHAVTLAFVEKEKIISIKKESKQRGYSLSQAMYTIAIRNDTAHALFLSRDQNEVLLDSFREDMNGSFCEWRYCEILMRKIIIWCTLY